MHAIRRLEKRMSTNGRMQKCIVRLNAIIPYILRRWRPDVEKMKKAAAYLIGTHDFTSFCSSKTATSNRVRTIRLLTLEKRSEELIMTIEGDGFLYNMVRTIAGMLLAVGMGWHTPENVKEILELRDRQRSRQNCSSTRVVLGKCHIQKLEQLCHVFFYKMLDLYSVFGIR